MLLFENIRYALRTSLRSPGFAAVTAISLALGIGANTAIFTILDAVLFRELPVPQARQLVELSPIYRNGGRVPFSFPMFQALDRSQRVFSGLYGWTRAASFNVEAGSSGGHAADRARLVRTLAPRSPDAGRPALRLTKSTASLPALEFGHFAASQPSWRTHSCVPCRHSCRHRRA